MTSEIKRRFTDTEMQTARETDLPELLTHLGYQVKRIGRYYTTAEMDSLRIKDRRTWFRYSQGIGGDAITFLQHFCNQSFPEAVEYLLTFQGRPRDAPVKTKPVTKQDKPPKEFALPPRNADDRRVFAYLRKRGIAAQVIRQFMNSGSLYEDAVHHNCVFVGRDHTGQAKYAGLRGTYDRDGKGFRGDVSGSDKDIGFAIPCDPVSDQVRVFEAPIDLIIDKIDSVTKQPLPGAQFKITTSDGSFVGNYGGTVASNGIYTTDSNGQIKLVDLKPDTYVVTEIKAPDGYVLDSTSQTVKVDRNDTQTLTFTNTPIGGGQIIKVDADSGERIKGVQFEIAKMNGERIGTYTTDSNGVITLPQLADGWYTATEIKAAKGYLLDSTPHNFEMKAGKTTSLTIENTQASSMLIHKIDSVTGKGIYGVTFLVSDSKGNPIGQYTSDQNGYVYIDKTLTDGKYLVREIQAADGYALDTTVKTFYVEYGGTSTITWKNTPITGQIQIVKKSADYNPTNGLPAETLLEGAVFEITDKAGNVVDTIRSNSRGLAVSKQLPLSRYFVREIKAPEHYGINDKELTAYLEYEGQILRFEVEDKSLSTGVAITKTGPKEIVAGQPVRYAFSGIANTSNVSLSNFYWRDTLPAQVRLDTVVTGTYNRPGTYKIVYRVNGGGHRTLADNLSTQKNYTLAASATALKLASNERVTEIMFVFGQAPAGFAQVEKPYLHCKAVTGLSAGSFVNVADVGGTYGGTWVQGISRWVTTVYGKPVIPTLPKTGY